MTKKELMNGMRLLAEMGFTETETLENGIVLREWYEAFENTLYEDFVNGIKRYCRSETKLATIVGVKGYVQSAALDRKAKAENEQALLEEKKHPVPCPDEIVDHLADDLGMKWAIRERERRRVARANGDTKALEEIRAPFLY